MTQPAQTALAQHRVTRLASQLPVHRAFHWLHLHGPQLRLWQMEFSAIPAPPFAEQARGRWFLDRFQQLGLSEVHTDGAGNILGELPAQNAAGPCLLVSAHLDTVFPAGTNTLPSEEGTRIHGPGICDNGAGLTGLLALIAALRFAAIVPPIPILFAANVGEEGAGDLRGMRHLCLHGSYAGRLAAALALEGAGTAAVVTRALGSRRFRITVTGPGGHSWSDAGTPNPILLVSRALCLLADLPEFQPNTQGCARSTFSPGHISGGTSINSIPAEASVDLDLRSTDATILGSLAVRIRQTFEQLASEAGERVAVSVAEIGNRPAGELPADSPALQTLRAVDGHLGLRTEQRLGSTDANLPLSLGIPAMALAAGGTCGGVHTLAEWYDPTGRETALRRILLTLLDLAQVFSAG